MRSADLALTGAKVTAKGALGSGSVEGLTAKSGVGAKNPDGSEGIKLSGGALSQTLSALADPTRRAILARLATGRATVNESAKPFDISLPAISRHLKVLQQAGLITRDRDAQFRPCELNTKPLVAVDGWLERYRRLWEGSFDHMDAHLDELQKKRPGSELAGGPVPVGAASDPIVAPACGPIAIWLSLDLVRPAAASLETVALFILLELWSGEQPLSSERFVMTWEQAPRVTYYAALWSLGNRANQERRHQARLVERVVDGTVHAGGGSGRTCC